MAKYGGAPERQRGAKAKTERAGAEKAGDASAVLPNWNYAALAQQLLQSAGAVKPDEISDAGAASKAGQLTLVATPIGHRGDITLRALMTLAQADLILCEDTRVSGALLKAYGIARPLLAYHDHNESARVPELVARLQAGAQIALISDAGMPVLADPGFRLVQACREAGIGVTLCPGPAAVLSALTISGLPPAPFLFAGFLPPKSGARRKLLAQWADVAATLAFYEAPQRLAESLADMAAVYGARVAVVARELTKLYEECRCGSLPELAAHYAAMPPKGEIVVLVGPPLVAEALSDDRLATLLAQALAEGSLRDAVEAVTAQSGRARAEVYALALKLKKAGDDA